MIVHLCVAAGCDYLVRDHHDDDEHEDEHDDDDDDERCNGLTSVVFLLQDSVKGFGIKNSYKYVTAHR